MDTSDDDLVAVFETSSQYEILIVKSLLEKEGIPYHFAGDFFHMSGIQISPAKLYVPAKLKEQVVEILKELQL